MLFRVFFSSYAACSLHAVRMPPWNFLRPCRSVRVLARRQNVNTAQCFAVFSCHLTKIAMPEIFSYFIIFQVNTNYSKKYITLLCN
jgi:hypothetical protein